MPKRGHTFTAQLSFGVRPEHRQKLIALGYLMGVAGNYAMPARNLLAEAIEKRIEGMGEKERAQFDEILRNVQIVESKESP